MWGLCYLGHVGLQASKQAIFNLAGGEGEGFQDLLAGVVGQVPLIKGAAGLLPVMEVGSVEALES